MASEMSMISVSKIYKDFGAIRALDELTLQIEPGIFGLIGPNGAGKTTLIRILVGLIRPDAGKGQVLGFDIRSNSVSIRRRIGVLHEKPSFPRNMKVQDYLIKVAMIYNSDASPEELLTIVDLTNASGRQIGNLSAGMLQRLGIAQALIGQPELVILDEPTSNLDVSGRDDVVSLIVKLHNELDVSFFISSHVLSELERACHQVAFIKMGKIIERGTVLDIIKKHTTETFRIITSDSKKLRSAIDDIPGLSKAKISGANAITVRIEGREVEEVKADVVVIAESLEIEIYAIEEAASLENAYRRIME
ncbi:MAG: ABC transporter ATP-binding protein [Candidatus Thorarchaeota archaeon]